MSNNALPEEMVMEIIAKLPSKSVIRFKSVCKPWCSLFSSSQFMTKHLLPDRDTGDLLLVKRRDKTNRDYVLSVLSDDTLIVDDHSQSLLLPPWPMNQTRSYPSEIKMLGYCCCNGVICLLYNSSAPQIVLWSPFVGDIKIVPPCNVPHPRGGSCYDPVSVFGFGYDANSRDYKVIIVTSWTINGSSMDGFKFDIYSSKTDSWIVQVYHDLPAIIVPGTRSGVYTNGVFSWWAMHPLEGELDRILWFRMSDESMGATRLPPSKDNNGVEYWIEPLVLNDQLGIVMSDWEKGIDKCFHVWALLEFGVEDSWTRLFTLGPFTGIERAVRFWKNGKMIMEDNNGDLVLCDPFTQDRETKSLNIGGLADDESDIQIVSVPAKYVP